VLSVHHALQFYPYDRPVKEGLDGLRPLKPGGIGVHGIVEGNATISWRNIEIAIEARMIGAI
jgi:hypothetical protein